jgi:thiosulfate dehydrogenase
MPPLTALLAAMALAASPSPSSMPPPAPTTVPAGELGEMVKLGEKLFEETGTHPLTREFVGNALSCASCHPGAGARTRGSTMVGAAAAYPAWSPREEAVITLEDRVLNCFMRSMNGVRPPSGSKASLAMAAYITWLSTGTPIGMNAKGPFGPNAVPKLNVDMSKLSVDAGRTTYEAKCASCHGSDGQADPPVWGPRSYNAGAGLAQVPRLASWLRVEMPPGDHPLTEEEAMNVAAYVNSQPRPDFVLRDHLPRGERAAAYNSNVLDEVIRAPTWPPSK